MRNENDEEDSKISIQSFVAALWFIFTAALLGFLAVGVTFGWVDIAAFVAIQGELGIIGVVILKWLFESRNNGTSPINEKVIDQYVNKIIAGFSEIYENLPSHAKPEVVWQPEDNKESIEPEPEVEDGKPETDEF